MTTYVIRLKGRGSPPMYYSAIQRGSTTVWTVDVVAARKFRSIAEAELFVLARNLEDCEVVPA